MKKLSIIILLFICSAQVFGQFEKIEWSMNDSLVETQIKFWENDSIRVRNKLEANKLFRYQYYENGVVQLKSEINQENDGETAYFFDETRKTVIDSTKKFYLMDSPNGIYIEYFLNGKEKLKGIKVAGRRNGEWLFFYNSGQLKEKVIYNDQGYRDGQYREFHKNGQLKTSGEYGTKTTIKATKCFDPNTFTEYDCEVNHTTEVKKGKWRYYNDKGESIVKAMNEKN